MSAFIFAYIFGLEEHSLGVKCQVELQGQDLVEDGVSMRMFY